MEKIAYETAVNQMAIGTLLLDHTGKVIACNQAATTMLGEFDSLSIRDGSLRLSDREQQRKLKHAIEVMLSDPEPDHAEVCSVSGSRLALSFLLRSFPPMSINTDRQPAVLVYMTAPSARQLPSQQVVGELFGLTATEARLAILLADGSSLLEAAEMMEITESTVRTYSKRIFGKTGVSRQSELVRLILKSVVQLAENDGGAGAAG
jgi:DNA-binding CsgD family transcriptional regulator